MSNEHFQRRTFRVDLRHNRRKDGIRRSSNRSEEVQTALEKASKLAKQASKFLKEATDELDVLGIGMYFSISPASQGYVSNGEFKKTILKDILALHADLKVLTAFKDTPNQAYLMIEAIGSWDNIGDSNPGWTYWHASSLEC